MHVLIKEKKEEIFFKKNQKKWKIQYIFLVYKRQYLQEIIHVQTLRNFKLEQAAAVAFSLILRAAAIDECGWWIQGSWTW